MQPLEQRAADRVEVRLRLVEQEDVRVLGEARGECDQLPLAAREGVRGQVQVGLFEPEVEQHRTRAAVDARPAGGLPALDQLLLAAEDARHLVEVGRELRCGELVGDAMQLAVELVEIGPSRTDGLERGPLVSERVLRQERGDGPRRRTDVPASGSSSPAMMRSMVDLPEPFAPMTPTRAPGSIAKSRPSSTVRLPNDLRTAFRLTTAIELPAANDGEHVLVLAFAQRIGEPGFAGDPGPGSKHLVEPIVGQTGIAACLDKTTDHR